MATTSTTPTTQESTASVPSQTRKAEHLTVDPPVVIKCNKSTFTQIWALASFVSPDDLIKERLIADVNRFLYHDVNQQLIDSTTHVIKEINTQFNNLMEKKINSYKTSKDATSQQIADILDSLRKEMPMNEDEQVSKVLRTYRISQEELTDRFDDYKNKNEKELESQFNQTHTNQTSVRGFKVRGVFEDYADAKAHAKKVRDEIEPYVHTFVFPAGYWVPWDPHADAVQDQEYMIPQLNDMMAQKKENERQKDEFFAKRKAMFKENADKENEERLKNNLKERIQARRNERAKK
uniref:Uncharacterized protein n=1 Tax=viral metagenome TaxID=1070528 RepID=A0A6C0BN81_9ZZZZ